MDPKALLSACMNAAMIAKVYNSAKEEKKTKAEKGVNKMLKNTTYTINEVYKMSFLDFIESNANEAMSSTETGFGKEFVPAEILDSMLVERLDDDESLLSMVNMKRMDGPKVLIWVRGKKIRMVWGVEHDEVPGTGLAIQRKKARTAELELNAKKLKLTIYFTDELAEDSVIAIGQYVLQELAAAFDTSMHEIILNGDVTLGNLVNINIIDGNTSGAATEEVPDGEKSDVIVINNGVREIAITKGTTVNAGVLDLWDIRLARKAMGVKGRNPNNLKLVPSDDVYQKILGLDEAQTIEKFGTAATVVNGVITAIDGIRIVPREEMRNATATGEISATPANNSTGQMALIHMPSVWVWVRTQFRIESDRDIEAEQTLITGSARVDVIFDDTQNNIKATSPVALIINITI